MAEPTDGGAGPSVRGSFVRPWSPGRTSRFDARESTDAAPDTAAMLSALQDQVDDLTATVEVHQRLFELLYAAGLLPRHDDGGPPVTGPGRRRTGRLRPLSPSGSRLRPSAPAT